MIFFILYFLIVNSFIHIIYKNKEQYEHKNDPIA